MLFLEVLSHAALVAMWLGPRYGQNIRNVRRNLVEKWIECRLVMGKIIMKGGGLVFRVGLGSWLHAGL